MGLHWHAYSSELTIGVIPGGHKQVVSDRIFKLSSQHSTKPDFSKCRDVSTLGFRIVSGVIVDHIERLLVVIASFTSNT